MHPLRWVRRHVTALGLTLAALGFWWFEALYGFTPTLDGFVLAQAWRVRMGEIPHVDFTSPRPLGSALLHLPEAMLGTGMLAGSRLVVTMQLLVIAVAFVRSGSQRPLRRLTFASLAVLAFMLDVGDWPVIAWHTIDGLFLAALAFELARAARTRPGWRWGLMWFLAGAAPLVKQGFVIVPVMVAIELLRHERVRVWRWMPMLLAPAVLFLWWVRPGPAALANQLVGPTSGNLPSLLVPLQALAQGTMLLSLAYAALCALLALRFAETHRFGSWVRTTVALFLLLAPTLALGYSANFARSSGWAFVPFASYCAIAAARWWRRHDDDLVLQVLGLLLLGYATTVSWAVPTPSLVAGVVLARSVLLLPLFDHRDGEPEESAGAGAQRHLQRIASVGLVVAALTGTGLVTNARAVAPFLDVPRWAMTSQVDLPTMRGIHVSPQLAAFENSLIGCVRKYPARWVAVAPVGAAQYPLLGLRNPFGIDWWLPPEVPEDHLARVVAVLQRLNASGDYLVLQETVAPMALASKSVAEVTTPAADLLPAPGYDALLNGLQGQPVTCGSFVGKYAPAH